MGRLAMAGSKRAAGKPKRTLVSQMLRRHFAPLDFADLTVSERKFPFRVAPTFNGPSTASLAMTRPSSSSAACRRSTPTKGSTFSRSLRTPITRFSVPPQYEEVHVGTTNPSAA